MTGSGIRKLAIGFGAALVLAGCEAAPTGNGGDPAAAALDSAEVSTTSLDGPAGDGAALPDAAATADPMAAVAKPQTPAAEAPPSQTTPRRGLFGFLKAKPEQTGAGADVTLVSPDPVAADTAPSGETDIAAVAAAALADAPAGDAALADAAAVAAAPVKERKGLFGFLRAKPVDGSAPAAAAAATPTRPSVLMVDRDVEAPDVFSVTDAGLWDGRPSLGGVWVAYSEVTDPERVIIRNTDTGAFVIGALFRRERENPGPRLQVSSDAADALGMLAGAPAKLNVTALRREEVVDPADAEALLGASQPIAESTVDPIAATAAAAIDAAAPAVQPPAAEAATLSAAEPAPATEPAPAPKPVASGGKNFLQVGIFSVEGNANGTAQQLQSAGLAANVIKESSQGKTYWRVIAGPAGSSAERDALLAKAKGLGFADAYFVSG